MNNEKISIIVQVPEEPDKDYALPKFGKKLIENSIADVSSEVVGKNILNLVKKFDHLLGEENVETENLDLDSVELNCVIGADGSISLIGNVGMQVSSSIKIKLVKKK
nr:hypothetical protein [Cytophagales bacterium]